MRVGAFCCLPDRVNRRIPEKTTDSLDGQPLLCNITMPENIIRGLIGDKRGTYPRVVQDPITLRYVGLSMLILMQKKLSNFSSTGYTGSGDPMDFWDEFAWKLIPQNDPKASEPTWTTPYFVRHLNPNVKLFLMLRDPVQRSV